MRFWFRTSGSGVRAQYFFLLRDPEIKQNILRLIKFKMPALSRSWDHENAGSDKDGTGLLPEQGRERIVVAFLVREDLLEEQAGRGITL